MNAQTVNIASSAISNTTCAGTAVTFTANLTGYTSPSYQWYKNSVAILGATSATYTSSSLINNDVIKVAVVEGAANVSTSNLVLNLDAGNSSSYTGSTTSWTDLTGRGNNGTISSGITYNAANGGYFQFPPGGSNGVILPASSNDFNFTTGDFAVELWANDYNNYGKLISLNTTNPLATTALQIYPVNATLNAGSLSTTGFTWTVWHNVIYTRISGVVYLYIDGVLKATANDASSLASNGTTTSNTLGSIVSVSNYTSFSGKMSIARVYKDAGLTSNQVVNNYNAICARYGLNAVGNTSNSITTTVNPSPAAPTLSVSGDACINKTTLSTTSGVYSYTWSKDNATISGATSNTYKPTLAGDYKVAVSNGTCSSTSSTTTIYTCGVTADGKMRPTSSVTNLLSNEGGINFGTGTNETGSIFNTTGLSTTTGTIKATSAIIGGVISATNAITSNIGVIYSTDINFGTYSSTTIQSNVVAGTYTTNISGLASSTPYYAKSYIVNKSGTIYGESVSFTTAVAYIAPTITTTGLVLNLDAAHPDSYGGSGTTWTDVSNNNNSVTLPTNIASSYSATTGGGSFTFNSNNATNKFSSTSINNWNINTTNAISVETWIKYTSNGGLQFYFQDAALNYRFGFDQIGHFYYDLGSHSDRNPSTATLTADTWHHLVITAGQESTNGNRVKSRFYIDGAEVYSNDEGISSLPNITTPYYFGDDPYHSYPLNASVGILRVYKTALSLSDITLNFNAQKVRFGF